MTDAEITAAYLKRETAANAKPEGADVRAICEEVAALAGGETTWRDVHSIVIAQTMLGAC